jgi:TetR/AcrR family transcriptional regulator, copper-responsive repressor
MGRPKIYDKDTLLKETAQLFWKKGLAETSLADIEKTTGVNKSSLYSEFSDKDEIFTASLSHYIQNNGVYELLDKAPLGKANIIEFLKLGKSCGGQRGCFVVNSIRESPILPTEAKDIIQAHLKKVKSKLIANIVATKFKGQPESCADLILTFNAGLCLELNATKNSPDAKIEDFLKLLSL